MSTASYVPPTRGLDSDDLKTALSRSSFLDFMRDSFLRFRKADGFTFARSLAFQVVFASIPGLIMVVAIAVRIGEGRMQTLIRDGITTLAPGPASELFLQAFEQGSEAAGTGNSLAILVGGFAALSSAVAGMAQLQRGASRIYGIQSDRDTLKRYGLATLLTLTVGLALTIAFVLIVIGSSVGGELQNEIAQTWAWARWPIGLGLLVGALALLFSVAPNRPQPSISWLAIGGAVAATGWLLISIGLAIYLNASRLFGETYGPLAGFMGVILWSQLTGIAVFYGIAVSAQLEAVRAGVKSPIDEDEHPEATDEAVMA